MQCRGTAGCRASWRRRRTTTPSGSGADASHSQMLRIPVFSSAVQDMSIEPVQAAAETEDRPLWCRRASEALLAELAVSGGSD